MYIYIEYYIDIAALCQTATDKKWSFSFIVFFFFFFLNLYYVALDIC